MRALRNALGGERGRWVLETRPVAGCEVELSGCLAGRVVHAIIDRTFVEGGIRWIVDYKTSEPRAGDDLADFLAAESERYRPQLETYAELCRRLEPGREVRSALYFPLCDGWVELDPVPAAG